MYAFENFKHAPVFALFPLSVTDSNIPSQPQHYLCMHGHTTCRAKLAKTLHASLFTMFQSSYEIFTPVGRLLQI